MEKINLQYIERALCFHGAPLQKIWDNERGADDLQRLGVSAQPNYDIYQQRQRFFTFQDRAKRLKLHQFFARKATDLYDTDLKKYANVPDEKHLEKAQSTFVTMPPYELFAFDPNDKDRKWHAVTESLKPGDIIYGMFTKTHIKPLCTAEPVVRYLNHLPIKGIVMLKDFGTMPVDANGKTRGYHPNEFVRCEVLRTSIEVDRVFLGFNGEFNKDPNIELGLVKREDLPLYYNKTKDCALQKYEECLKTSKEFLNPNYEVLYSMNGLDINDTFTMMGALKLPFPQHEMAKELRKAQAHKWAFRSVAEGIELFKNGHHLEAFQCLNKALNIDPYNVEGLVARGALFANRGSFHKAVDDFGSALKLDKFHANARKYMGETLVALGRSLEEDKRFDEAAKAYKDCLDLIPNHMQAMGCLEALNQHLTGSLLDSTFFDNLFNIPATTGTELLSTNDEVVNVINSTSSDDSSSDSDTSDSDGDSAAAKTSTSKFKKSASLSPLSKRLALHAASMRGIDAADNANMNKAPTPPSKIAPIRYDQPFFATRTSVPDANEFKLDDDDTQSRVLKLIEQASAHTKDKKKKTKKNKNKKAKKDSKKSKKVVNDAVSSNMPQSLFQSNYLLETFKNIGNENFQQQLSKDIVSYESKIAEIQKRQEMLRQSMTIGKESTKGVNNFDESPPPPPSILVTTPIPPAGKIHVNLSKLNNKTAKFASNTTTAAPSTTTSSAFVDANRLSFQIKRPVKVDKFGLVRIATPLKQRSPSLTRDEDKESLRSRRRQSSRSRSRTRSPYRRSSSRHRRYRSSRSRSRRSGSTSPYRRRHRRSRSRSKSRYDARRRRDSRDSISRRRKSRSPYLRRRSRSRSNDRNYTKNSSNHWEKNRNFANRTWQRPGYAPPPNDSDYKSKSSDQRWQHDKFEEINRDPLSLDNKNSKEEGPTIEEIDEIINKAQKERKAEIIKRDKEILKRPISGQF